MHKRARIPPPRARRRSKWSAPGTSRSTRRSSQLSIGGRQLVEIARMLTRDARVFILDEPTATLSDVEIERIFAALRALKREGKSIIYITHRLGEVFQICDSVTVLRNGELVGTRRVAEIDRKALMEMMLGRSFGEMYPAAAAAARRARCWWSRTCACRRRVESFDMSAPRRQDRLPRRPGRLRRDRGGARARRPGARRHRRRQRRRASRSRFARPRARSGSNVSSSRAIAPRRACSSGCAWATTWSRRGSADYASSACCKPAALRAAARELADKVGVDRAAAALAGRRTERRQPAEACLRPLRRSRRAGRAADERADPRRRRRRARRNLPAHPGVLRRGLCLVMTSCDIEEVVGHGRHRHHHVSRPAGRRLCARRGRRCTASSADITHPVERRHERRTERCRSSAAVNAWTRIGCVCDRPPGASARCWRSGSLAARGADRHSR